MLCWCSVEVKPFIIENYNFFGKLYEDNQVWHDFIASYEKNADFYNWASSIMKCLKKKIVAIDGFNNLLLVNFFRDFLHNFDSKNEGLWIIQWTKNS